MTIIDSNTPSPQLAPDSVIATMGMFDGVHRGHATLLTHLVTEAACLRLKSAVVTFRQHPQLVFNPNSDLRMILPLNERLRLIASFGVDYVILLDFTPQLAALTSSQFMSMLRDNFGISHLIVGFNHHFGHNREDSFPQYVAQGRELGVTVLKAPEYLGRYAPVSSSIIRKLISSGRVEDAALCMGRPFSISGIVVHGFKNGRKIGFPTANVGEFYPLLILPHNGVYAGHATVSGISHNAMINIGCRPTLHNGKQITVEANLFDFDDDIYGQPITVTFTRFMRYEVMFSGLDELKRQLAHDRDESIKILAGK